MALVTLVLVVVFSCLVAAFWRSAQRQVDLVLEKALERGSTASYPSLELPFSSQSDDERTLQDFLSYPVFVVTVNPYGYVTQVVGQNVAVSLELGEQSVIAALATGKEEGAIPGVNLQFSCIQTSGGMRYAFVETSSLHAGVAAMIATCLLALMCSLIPLFLIARFLGNQAVRPVEAAWEQQRQFIADASHELKTPLTVILANTGILLSHKDSTIGEQSKWLENTGAEAQRMKDLVEKLLFLARSDSGRMPLMRSSVSLSDTVWSCLLPYETIAFEAGITLNSDVADGVVLVGDANQLKQLVLILLDNACKYTPAGGVIGVRLTRTGDRAQLTVHNTGPAIPAEDLPHLFERFYRSDKARTRDTGGYGLGLSIAKMLVESHQGKIAVESSEEHGTTFTVTLPVGKEKNTALPPAQQKKAE